MPYFHYSGKNVSCGSAIHKGMLPTVFSITNSSSTAIVGEMYVMRTPSNWLVHMKQLNVRVMSLYSGTRKRLFGCCPDHRDANTSD